MIEKIWVLIIRRNDAPAGWSAAKTLAGLSAVLHLHGLDDARSKLENLDILEDQFLYNFAADGEIYELYRCELHG